MLFFFSLHKYPGISIIIIIFVSFFVSCFIFFCRIADVVNTYYIDIHFFIGHTSSIISQQPTPSTCNTLYPQAPNTTEQWIYTRNAPLLTLLLLYHFSFCLSFLTFLFQYIFKLRNDQWNCNKPSTYLHPTFNQLCLHNKWHKSPNCRNEVNHPRPSCLMTYHNTIGLSVDDHCIFSLFSFLFICLGWNSTTIYKAIPHYGCLPIYAIAIVYPCRMQVSDRKYLLIYRRYYITQYVGGISDLYALWIYSDVLLTLTIFLVYLS